MNTSTESLVVFESMFGATRAIAHAIAQGFGCEATNVSTIGEVGPSVRLLVAGAPTHVHGLSRPETRREAQRWASEPFRSLTLEPHTESGMREWLAEVESVPPLYAAFDTRADMPKLFSGSASSHIASALKHFGAVEVEPPASFLVDKTSHLLAGELERAYTWGQHLRGVLATRSETRAAT